MSEREADYVVKQADPSASACPSCGAPLQRANDLPREHQPQGMEMRCDFCGRRGWLVWWHDPPELVANPAGAA